MMTCNDVMGYLCFEESCCLHLPVGVGNGNRSGNMKGGSPIQASMKWGGGQCSYKGHSWRSKEEVYE